MVEIFFWKELSIFVEIMNYFRIFLFISLFSSCTLSNEYIQSHIWKAGEGRFELCNHCDVIDFNRFKLINDTIYSQNKAIAKIIKTQNGNIGHVNEIEIGSLINTTRIVYYDLGKQ